EMEVADVCLVPPDGPGGLLVRAGLERVFARDSEQVPVLVEGGLDLLVGPGHPPDSMRPERSSGRGGRGVDGAGTPEPIVTRAKTLPSGRRMTSRQVRDRSSIRPESNTDIWG